MLLCLLLLLLLLGSAKEGIKGGLNAGAVVRASSGHGTRRCRRSMLLPCLLRLWRLVRLQRGHHCLLCGARWELFERPVVSRVRRGGWVVTPGERKGGERMSMAICASHEFHR